MLHTLAANRYRPLRFIALALLTLVAVPRFAQGQGPAAAAAAAAKSGQQYSIFIYETPAELKSRTSTSGSDTYWSAYDDYAAVLMKAGALRGGSALSETTAKTVRGAGSADRGVSGARLGGYFVIETASLAEAERLAKLAPPRAIAVELRPHRPNPHMMAPAPAP